MKHFFAVLLLAGFFVGVNSAGLISLGADNAPFRMDSNVLFKGFALTASGAADANKLVNLKVFNASQSAVWDKNIYSDVRGFFSFDLNFNVSGVGDYNAVAIDLNANNDVNFSFGVTRIYRVNLSYRNANIVPPFDSNIAIVPVNFQIRDVNNAIISTATDLNVLIKSDDGNVVDSNSGITNTSTGDVNLNFNLSGKRAGNYFFVVNNGVAVFSFRIFSFKFFAELVDSGGNLKQFFNSTDNSQLRVFVTDFNGSRYFSDAVVTAKVYDSNDSLKQSLSLANSGLFSGTGTYVSDLNTASYANGNYYVLITVTRAGVTQTNRVFFGVQSHRMNFVSKKNDLMGEFEKMPSLFAPDSNVSFEAHIFAIGGSELSLQQYSTACSDANFSLFYKNGFERSFAKLPDANLSVHSDGKSCLVDFNAPKNSGNYQLQLTAKDINVGNSIVSLSAESTLLAQNVIIFFEPVDSGSCDSTAVDKQGSCGFKLGFVKGEKISLRPTIIKLNSNITNIDINAVRNGRIFSNKGLLDLNNTDVNWNRDYNLVELLPNGSLSRLSGGSFGGEVYVDINSTPNTYNQESLTAFLFFKLSVLNVSVDLVDVNGNSKVSFGPPVFSPDENVFFKVTVTDSANRAISNARVFVNTLFNEEKGKSIVSDGLDANTVDGTLDYNKNSSGDFNVTNSNGIATIKLNSGRLNINSGTYFGEISIDDNANSKTDSIEVFFFVRSYLVFLEPVDSNSPCNERGINSRPMVSRDGNLTFIVEAFDPTNFTPIRDVNITSVTAFYAGTPEKPSWPPVDANNVASISVEPYRCRLWGETQQDVNLLRVYNRGSSWKQGFYPVFANAVSTNRGSETAQGFFMSQDFFAMGIPISQFNGPPTAAPNSQFDFNFLTSSDVNLTIKLVDSEQWQTVSGAGDLNIAVKSASGIPIRVRTNGVDLNLAGAGMSVGANSVSNIPVTVDVNIPNVAVGEYLLRIRARKADGNTADAELFLRIQPWQLLLPTTQSIGVPELSLESDSNILNNANTGDLNLEWGNSIDVNGLTYDKIAFFNRGSEGLDWNGVNVLVNSTQKWLVIDLDRDNNFFEENRFVEGNFVSGITTTNSMLGSQYNGKLKITSITKKGVKYTTSKLIDLNSSTNANWSGDFPANTDINIPVLVKTLAGLPVVDANVQVLKIMKVEFGGGIPTELASADYNDFRVKARTDGNGFALLGLSIAKTGNYQLLLKVTSDGNNLSQKIDFWNGPMFRVINFSLGFDFARGDFNAPGGLQFDKNAIIAGINQSRVTISSLLWNDNNRIAIFNEQTMSFDLDDNGTIDDKNYYFLKLIDGNLVIDDDADINREINGKDFGLANERGIEELVYGGTNIGKEIFPQLLNQNDSNTGLDFNETERYSGSIIDNNLVIYNWVQSNMRNEFRQNTTLGDYLKLNIRTLDNAYTDQNTFVTGKVYNLSNFSVVQNIPQTMITNGRGRIKLQLPNSSPLPIGRYLVKLDANINNLIQQMETDFGLIST